MNVRLETNVIVTMPHTRSYEAPITLEPGAQVAVLKRDTTWPEWLWCRDAGGREGWVHQSVLSVEGERATAPRSYDAMELTAGVGERLRCSKRLGGWAWCLNDQGQAGWIPEANLKVCRHSSGKGANTCPHEPVKPTSRPSNATRPTSG